MTTYRLTEDQIEFMLPYLPSLGSLTKEQQDLYFGIMKTYTSAKRAPQTFYFPLQQNKDLGLAVPIIKAIRVATGFGLKEAKEAWDNQTKFKLCDWKMSKEQVTELVNSMSTQTAVIIFN